MPPEAETVDADRPEPASSRAHPPRTVSAPLKEATLQYVGVLSVLLVLIVDLLATCSRSSTPGRTSSTSCRRTPTC